MVVAVVLTSLAFVGAVDWPKSDPEVDNEEKPKPEADVVAADDDCVVMEKIPDAGVAEAAGAPWLDVTVAPNSEVVDVGVAPSPDVSGFPNNDVGAGT